MSACFGRKARKLKAPKDEEKSEKAQLQYRDDPRLIAYLKKLGEASSLGPSDVIGTFVRHFIVVPGEVDDPQAPFKDSQMQKLSYLKGLIEGFTLSEMQQPRDKAE